MYALARVFRFDGQVVPLGYVPCTTLGELDTLQAWEAELEENIRRVDLTWQEQAAATGVEPPPGQLNVVTGAVGRGAVARAGDTGPSEVEARVSKTAKRARAEFNRLCRGRALLMVINLKILGTKY